ncbi:MAG: DUF1501 domain-containing protein [Planctomycetaceae bacterium]|nr:DUF1501 domain-containing protein [Planctomycetaceae bacterium]
MIGQSLDCSERLPSLSRRSLLNASLGLISLPTFLQRKASLAGSGPQGKAKPSARSCIVLYCWGGMSHLETFDPKPLAPIEIRGEFLPISTSVPGIQVSEHLPRLAKIMGYLAVVRSVHHTSSSHGKGMYWNLTGHAPAQADVAANLPPSMQDWPSLGAMIPQFLASPRGVPGSIRLPYPLVDNGTLQAGEYAGWLGVTHSPIVMRPPGGTEFAGVSRNLGSAVLNLKQEVDELRFKSRAELLHSIERPVGGQGDFPGFDHFRQMAGDILTTDAVKKAYNLSLEPSAIHQAYGQHICGQSLLLSRRLSEAGVPIVTVCCAAGDLNGSVGDHWDTHGDNFGRLKNRMLPVFDQAASALITDLDQRGELDDTLVVMLTDFGRTPRVNAGAGRDHYPGVYSVFLAGAGIQGGQVYGSSDAQGAFPSDSPCTPADLHATIFKALGISVHAELRDHLNRPMPVCDGDVLPLFG